MGEFVRDFNCPSITNTNQERTKKVNVLLNGSTQNKMTQGVHGIKTA